MILVVAIGLIGLICLYFEFFVPGGVLALLVGVLMLASLVLFFVESSHGWTAWVYFVVLVLAAIGVCRLALVGIKHSRRSNTFFLQDDQEGSASSFVLSEELVGKEGVVSTELKPSGHVRVDGVVYQAVSQGQFLSKGAVVRVVSVTGPRLEVIFIKNKEPS